MEIGSSMVVDELARGREATRQLQADIDSGCSADTCQFLAKEILSAFDRSIFMVTSGATAIGTDSAPPWPLAKSPRADFEFQQHGVMCKKRKVLSKWTSQVRLGSGPGVEGPNDDGYKWRKYGQKDILGAKHPRGYYRCTHRKSQGCLATKQVQLSEDSPLVFDVTYRGAHTCEKRPSASREPLLLPPQNDQDLFLSFPTGLEVKTEGLDFESPEPSSSSLSLSFSFPSTPVDSVKPEALTFPPSALDDCLVGCGGAFSNAFVSPGTSGSNYFSTSPCGRMGSYGGQTRRAAESDFAEIVSALTTSSPTNSPMMDVDFLLDSADLDQEFPFDACSFLS